MHPRDIPYHHPHPARRSPGPTRSSTRSATTPARVYVERFWLGILGPCATWLMRHLVDGLDAIARRLSSSTSTSAPPRSASAAAAASSGAFPRTIARCCQFGASPPRPRTRRSRCAAACHRSPAARSRGCPRCCRPTTPAGSIRPRPPSTPTTCATRLAGWRCRCVELGEDGDGTERQLHRWRFHPALASEATAWALERHRSCAAGRAARAGRARSRGHRFHRAEPEVIGSDPETYDLRFWPPEPIASNGPCRAARGRPGTPRRRGALGAQRLGARACMVDRGVLRRRREPGMT